MRSQHQFSNVPRADIPRSSFNLSHGHKSTFDVDFLIPILVQDIIPSSTWNVSCSFFMRLATPLHSILDNMYAETFFFFVPYRTLWVNFEKFHGAQDDPGDSIVFTIPQLIGVTHGIGDLGDYMGIPPGVIPTNTGISALPFRAYRKIYNEWFRDENLQDSIIFKTDNGTDDNADAGYNDLPLKRGKRFDYFTSCLPAPQKGTAVSFPIGKAEVKTAGGIGAILGILAPSPTYQNIDTGAATADVSASNTNAQTNALFVDDSTATINDIRLAFQTQRLLERDARSGTRYVETLKAHWGAVSSDQRLQRAEFLGGGSTKINVNAQPQTSGQATPALDDALGKMGAFGTVAGTHSFSKSFTEHGVLIGLVNVRGDVTYSQGLDRMWGKTTRFDFYYPVLSGIGEQAVTNKEIWVTWADSGTINDAVFGYQERYGEHRVINSRLSGLMRPDAAGTLAAWHLSEDFSSLPSLGATFITANLGVPLDRAIGVATEPHLYADFFFEIKAALPMPVHGIPGNLDRL